MTNETPQWALDKAAKLAGYDDYQSVIDMQISLLRGPVRAHAAALAKYETEPVVPVDPVLVNARRLLAGAYERKNMPAYAKQALEYLPASSAELQAIMEAIRLPAMGDDK